MRLAVTYPDPEPLVVDLIEDALASVDHDFGTVTVSKTVPPAFNPTNPLQALHVQVALDGTPVADHPVAVHATVRLVAWAPTGLQSKAIRLTNLVQGLLLAHPGGDGIASTLFLTGALPAEDPSTHAEIAATTTRVSLRSIPIEPTGS